MSLVNIERLRAVFAAWAKEDFRISEGLLARRRRRFSMARWESDRAEAIAAAGPLRPSRLSSCVQRQTR